MASGSCVVSRRDRPGKEGKEFGVSAEPSAFVQHVSSLLEDVQVHDSAPNIFESKEFCCFRLSMLAFVQRVSGPSWRMSRCVRKLFA